MIGLDVSNWSGTSVTADSLTDARDNHDVGLILPQAVDPPAGYPVGVTRSQVDAALSVDLSVEPYIWIWFSATMDDIKRKLDLLSGYEGKLARLWLDVEDTYGGVSTSGPKAEDPSVLAARQERLRRQGPRPHRSARSAAVVDHNARTDLIQQALNIMAAFPVLAGPPGIYSGSWYWGPYMGNTSVFAQNGYPAWPSDYDNNPDTTVWAPYGGWTVDQIALKQYVGTSNVGKIQQCDINSVAQSEVDLLHGAPQPPPDPTPDPNADPRDQRISDLTTALSDVVNSDGEIRTALAAAKKLKGVAQMRNSITSVDMRLDAIRTEFLS